MPEESPSPRESETLDGQNNASSSTRLDEGSSSPLPRSLIATASSETSLLQHISRSVSQPDVRRAENASPYVQEPILLGKLAVDGNSVALGVSVASPTFRYPANNDNRDTLLRHYDSADDGSPIRRKVNGDVSPVHRPTSAASESHTVNVLEPAIVSPAGFFSSTGSTLAMQQAVHRRSMPPEPWKSPTYKAHSRALSPAQSNNNLDAQKPASQEASLSNAASSWANTHLRAVTPEPFPPAHPIPSTFGQDRDAFYFRQHRRQSALPSHSRQRSDVSIRQNAPAPPFIPDSTHMAPIPLKQYSSTSTEQVAMHITDDDSISVSGRRRIRHRLSETFQNMTQRLKVHKSTHASLVGTRKVYRKERFTRSANKESYLRQIFSLSFVSSFFVRFLTSTQLDVILTVIDLIVDVLFLLNYAVELSLIVPVPYAEEPIHVWFWVTRPLPVLHITFALSVYVLLSSLLNLIFMDDRISYFTSFLFVTDLLTAVPLVIAYFFDAGQLLYVPYFLRCWAMIVKLRRALRLRAEFASDGQPYDPLSEQLAVLIASIVSLLYSGMCAFHFTELVYAGIRYDFVTCLYFIIITSSTVGYGDIAPSTIPSKLVVIAIILAALLALPGLISALLETLALQKDGRGGFFRPGRNSDFVVVCSDFGDENEVSNVLNELLNEEAPRALKVVLLARQKPTPAISALIRIPKYKNHVFMFQGSLLNERDLARLQFRKASAIFVMADNSSGSMSMGDEHNMLRLWAIHDHAPDVPLYVNNLLPETEMHQRNFVYQIISTTELRQVLLGFSCLYKGSATLISNLVHQYTPSSSYPELWQAEYGDGAGNEIYVTSAPVIFLGRTFAEVSWIIYREFQMILFAIKTYLPGDDEHHLVLNPGHSYRLRPSDELFLMAHDIVDIQDLVHIDTQAISNDGLKSQLRLSPHTQRRLPTENVEVREGVSLPPPHLGTLPTDPSVAQGLEYFPSYPNATARHIYIGLPPDPPYVGAKMQLCYLLRTAALVSDSLLLCIPPHLPRHILILAHNYELFLLISSLRSCHLNERQIRPVLIFCDHPPTEPEWRHLSFFPDLYVVVGDLHKETDLERAGIVQADKVVVMTRPDAFVRGQVDNFIDSTAIMITHQLQHLFVEQKKKSVITELAVRESAKYVRPTLKRKSRLLTKTSEYIYSPPYAAGRVMIAALLDGLLFQTYTNPCVVDVIRLLVGVRDNRDFELDRRLQVATSYLCYIDTPTEFVNRSFADLYRYLAIERGIIPLGLYRARNATLGNELPYVYTNPLPSAIVQAHDLIYVIKFGVE